MSRFICPEAEGAQTPQQAAQSVLMHVMQSRNNEMLTMFQDTSGQWNRIAQKINKERGYDQSFFALSEIYGYAGRVALTDSELTIQQLAAALGVAITEPVTDAGSFRWNIRSVYELFALPYWLTIYTEKGVILSAPKRSEHSVYRGRVDANSLILRTTADRTVGYAGESGFDYTIAADTRIVAPALVDAARKTQAINKHKALREVIMFRSGVEAEALDWVQTDDGVYIIVGCKTETGISELVYIAVREYDETASFSAGDVAVGKIIAVAYKTVDTTYSADTHSTVSGYTANINTHNILYSDGFVIPKMGIYEISVNFLFDSYAGNSIVYVEIHRNATQETAFRTEINDAQTASSYHGKILPLEKGDVVNFKVYPTSSSVRIRGGVSVIQIKEIK